jgi:uncharacterized protein YhbP (UPF0306 family)
MNEKIIHFISKQTCGNLCTMDAEGKPWCFTFFYAFYPDDGLLYFKTHDDARHTVNMKANPIVAGTILPDKFNHLQIKGIQFEGEVLPLDHELSAHASSRYHHKHPIALAMSGDVWTVKLNVVKFTDNTLGFGTKFVWSRES